MKHHPEITDSMVEIFISILTGGDANKRLAAELIRKLGPEARRDLRAACQDLDNLVDDVWLEELSAIGRTGEDALGAHGGINLQLPVFLRANSLQPFISNDLTKSSDAIKFC